jgi:hypothetical protein
MIELLVITALVGAPPPTGWPADCDKVGEIYFQAAQIRDSGAKLEDVLPKATEKRPLRHVYERKDMTPEQWRWFVIGVCAGETAQDRDRA